MQAMRNNDMFYKPCPFCGGEAELDFADKGLMYIDAYGNLEDTGLLYTVKCINLKCGCSIGVYSDPNMAVAAWNDRKDDNDAT